MRIVLLSTVAISLAACSVAPQGGNQYIPSNAQMGAYNHQQPQMVQQNYRLSRINVEGGIGTELVTGAKLLRAGDAVNTPANVVHNNVSMKQAFKRGLRYDLGASYALNPNLKLSATAYKTKNKGKEGIVVGAINGQDLMGDMSDYDSWGLEAGLRQYGGPMPIKFLNSARGYVEARAGAAHVDEIGLTNMSRNGIARADMALYNKGWVPTAAGLIGIETPLFKQATIGIESGIRYNGKLDNNMTGRVAPGNRFEGVNSGSDKWSIPVNIRGRIRF